jgi:hypothetical protein
MKNLIILLSIFSISLLSCGGDPSTEKEHYNDKTTTTGGDPSQPEYDQKTDILKDSINDANSGTINNDPNGVNVMPEDK